jgi:signal peptidase I
MRPRAAGQSALVAALVAVFARTFLLASATITSGSMSPTLLPGDRVLIDRWSAARRPPGALTAIVPAHPVRRGEVVWLRSPIDPFRHLVKRCAAIEGERFAGGYLPAGSIAVLGDRRADSYDSRRFGPLPRSAVRGRVVLVLWSADRDGVRWRRIGDLVR